jgi:hypothetical protein
MFLKQLSINTLACYSMLKLLRMCGRSWETVRRYFFQPIFHRNEDQDSSSDWGSRALSPSFWMRKLQIWGSLMAPRLFFITTANYQIQNYWHKPRLDSKWHKKATTTTGLSLHVQLHKHDDIFNLVRFQVLTAASMKMRVFWDIVPRSLVAEDRRFRGTYCLHL